LESQIKILGSAGIRRVTLTEPYRRAVSGNNQRIIEIKHHDSFLIDDCLFLEKLLSLTAKGVITLLG
jgi:hypothetical protein